METTDVVKYKNWDLNCKSYGSKKGEAILLVHGASSDQRIWKYLVDCAKADFFVVTMDLLGHGLSDKPESTYDLEVWAENILSVIKHYELDRVNLVAHSFGVLVTKQFYHSHTDLIKTITIVDGNLKQVLGDAIYNWMKTTLERPDYEEYMRSLNQKKQAFCLKKKDSDLVSEGVENTPKHVLKGQLEAMRYGTDLEVQINVPVLAFYAQSHEWNEDAEVYLRSHTDQLDLHVWDDVTHFMMLEQPERMWHLLSKFLLDTNKTLI